jgi:MSHA biogenesis protein MshE
MTGHLVLSTLHTNDAISTPIRLLDMGVPRYLVASSLQVVLAQRLVRLVCESCAEPHKLSPAEHAWLKAELADSEDSRGCMHGRGCSHCNGMGYLGRTGVYEMLEMTRAVVDAANDAAPGIFAKVAQAQMGVHTLRRRAAALVVAGRTTVAEAMRITNEFDD